MTCWTENLEGWVGIISVEMRNFTHHRVFRREGGEGGGGGVERWGLSPPHPRPAQTEEGLLPLFVPQLEGLPPQLEQNFWNSPLSPLSINRL